MDFFKSLINALKEKMIGLTGVMNKHNILQKGIEKEKGNGNGKEMDGER